MNHNKIIQQILNQKPDEQSFFLKVFTHFSHYFWFSFCIRKNSHRKRILKAKYIFKQIKKPEFQQEPARLFAYIRKIDPFVFEELLLLAFRSRGFKVRHNKCYTGDGGIDGMVIMPNKKPYAIQAKRYQGHVHAKHLDDFALDLKRQGCFGGFFVHSGKSGLGVYQRLSPDVILISGFNLHRLLTGY